jgi:hypothetical protein
MNTAIWAVVIGALALVGNLVNGYLQRKQMRQNELFRRDPSVGLIPPPHPLRTHLWKYRSLYVNFGGSALSFAVGFGIPGPLTRGLVLNISMGVCLYFYAFVSHGQDRVLHGQDRHLEIIQLINKTLGTMAETQGITVKALEGQLDITKKLIDPEEKK